MSIFSDAIATAKQDLAADWKRIKTGSAVALTEEGEAAKAAVADAAATVADVAKNAVSSTIAAMATVNYSGSTGDFTSAYETISLFARFIPVTDTNPNDYGSPYMRRVQLNTLSGFILCENPHFSLSIGMITEADLIKTYMQKGFYFE